MQTNKVGMVTTVLLVEDHEALRALDRRVLETEGSFKVVAEAADGAEAIEAARSSKPDIVLLDIAMPVMNGIEALPLIRKASPRSRIVIHTMLQRDPWYERSMAAGADAFIDKGVTNEELVSRLQTILKASPARA
jgi:DNA-binding NarL/FixJ family response regulator